MKILSPLTRIEEIEPLIEAGADQFYCGIVDTENMNDRPNTARFNFESIEDFKEAARIVKERKKELFLAINTPTIGIEKGLMYAKLALESSAKGLIIANELLIKTIHEKYPELKIFASCITGAMNTQALKFLNKLGAEGIHLPRHLGISELKTMKENFPNMDISVFGYEGMCVNIECFCSLHYLKKDYFIPCDHFRTKEIIRKKSNTDITKEMIDNRIISPDYSCGLCALKSLKNIGIDVIKIEGRDLDKKTKMKQIKIIKSGINAINSNNYIEKCKTIFKKYHHEECKESYCYY